MSGRDGMMKLSRFSIIMIMKGDPVGGKYVIARLVLAKSMILC